MNPQPTRRQVLKGGAAAAAAAGMVDFQSVLKSALAAPACGSIGDIQHVVIFIQENHSFDQYFGRYKGVRGFNDRSVRLHPGDDGTSVYRQDSTGSIAGTPNPLLPFKLDTAVSVPPHQGDCINDVEHQWIDEHDMWNDGKLDRWILRHVVSGGANGPKFAPTTMGYYDGSPARDGSGEMDVYWSLADNFTILDNYYCSVIGGTDANRLMSVSGTIDPDGWDGGLQFLDTATSGATFPFAKYDIGTKGKWLPYPQVLDQHGVSWKIYGSPDQASVVSDNVLRYFPQFRPTGDPNLFLKAFAGQSLGEFLVDCEADNLPQVSWILTNAADSEHAPASALFGQDTAHMMVTALMSNPAVWAKSAMFLTYDENGGFFDHVPPPSPPPGTPGEYLDVTKLGLAANAQGKLDAGAFASKPIGLGFRVPGLVISPFSVNPNPHGGPMVCSDQFDHTSLLKFVERRFGAEIPGRDAATQRPGLSAWRRDAKNIGDLTSAFNFAAGPVTGAVTLAASSHTDPRSLTECPTTALSLGTGTFTDAYPIATPVPFPVQEASPGAVVRPSGVCAATTTSSSPSPVAGSGAGLPGTSTAGDLGAPVAALLGGIGVASAWWARRRAEAAETEAG